MVPYLELLVRNGLAERIEGGVTRHKTTGEENKEPSAIGELISDLAVIKVTERPTKD